MQDMLFNAGFMVFILGFLLIFISIIIFMVEGIRGRGKVKGGGLILIGPIPIGFGTDRETFKWMIILAVVIIIVFFAWSLAAFNWRV